MIGGGCTSPPPEQLIAEIRETLFALEEQILCIPDDAEMLQGVAGGSLLPEHGPGMQRVLQTDSDHADPLRKRYDRAAGSVRALGNYS